MVPMCTYVPGHLHHKIVTSGFTTTYFFLIQEHKDTVRTLGRKTTWVYFKVNTTLRPHKTNTDEVKFLSLLVSVRNTPDGV